VDVAGWVASAAVAALASPRSPVGWLLRALLAAVAVPVDGFVVDAADAAAGASWW
jgi:hypothetical protein